MATGSLLVAALCAWCAWASGLRHSTSAAFATWAVSTAAVVVIDLLLWRGRRRGDLAIHLRPADQPWPRPGQGGIKRSFAGTAPWWLLALVVVIWEVLGIDTGPHEPHLTISALSQAFRPVHAGILLVWILVGLGYGVARARAPVEQVPGGPAPGGSLANLSGALAVSRRSEVAPALLLPANRAVGVAFWVAVVAACVFVDLAARRSRGRLASAEELLRFISGPAPGKVALVAAWTYAGWHLFAH